MKKKKLKDGFFLKNKKLNHDDFTFFPGADGNLYALPKKSNRLLYVKLCYTWYVLDDEFFDDSINQEILS